MKSIIAKYKVLLVAIILVVLQFSPAIQKAEARLTTALYIAFNHNDMKINHKNTEFDSHFGEYLVSYQDDSGKSYSFMIKPKYFPVIVSYDPFDQSR